MIASVRRSVRLASGLALTGLVAGLLAGVSIAPSQSAPPNHNKVVSAVPSNTPAVDNGSVRSITQIGDQVVLAGNFTRARSVGGSQVTRNYLLSFDADTGQISSSFVPSLNGSVEEVLPGPTANTLYVVGGFSQVNGANSSRVTLLNLSDGSRVPGFNPPALNGRANTIQRSGNRIFVGGNFTNAGGSFYGGLVALDATSGNVMPYLNLPVTERHNNSGHGAQGAVGVRDLDVTPDGSRLVAIGNFKRVDGQPRDQAVVIDLTSSSATVANWQTRRYEPYCFNWAFDTYVRGIDMAPDGSYFVISTTGGHNNGTLCDTAARFESNATGSNIQPSWVADTGGDTLWAVETTEEAVYVGGHQRWFNNALGSDRAEPGAVPRPGIAALDPRTGVPLKWNPGRNPRGAAVYALHASSSGLWMGSDTQWVGNRDYRRPRVAFFPLASGAAVADDSKPTLPGSVYLGGPGGSTLRTVAFNGTTAGTPSTANSGGIDWSRVRGAFRVGNSLIYGQNDGALYKRSFDNGSFGPATKLDPYNDPAWAGVDTGSGNTYDGRVSAFYSQIPSVTGMYYDNGRLFYTLQGQSALFYRFFSVDSGIVGVDQFQASTGRNWSTTSGLFAAGNTVYAASSISGSLTAITVQNGIPSGSSSTVGSGVDWRARGLFIGGAAQTVNEPPTAAFTADCTDLSCDVDAGGSNDTDGSIASYAWDFGDGDTGSGEQSQHSYAAPGTYTVELTVTDAADATDVATRQVQVTEPQEPPTSDLTFRDSASAAHDSAHPRLSIPDQAQAGDTLVAFATFASDSPNPVAPAGWTPVADETFGNMAGFVWTKTATASDAGASQQWTLSGSPKATLTIGAYGGADSADPIGDATVANASSTASHTTPSATAGTGDWVLSYWADRSSSTTAWSSPGSVAARESAYGAAGGRITSRLADSDGPVASGQVGGVTATTDASSPRSMSWTIVLHEN
ncbi:PKD domain-containing protein [Solicola gregarius]|uniref:PKD domain-containing protein n=1 Tax=Solicola gregarius TaxID=2908642 RepID=A0AA46TK29_9ACTN|nr:PKD domain-containing protein [Solicola gregarius]UYM06545.1 PKD domain-containing protein [Solicola gregarius]